MSFVIQPNEKVVFFGDSITDCGRRGGQTPLGDGYVKQIHDMIVAKYPAHQNTIINVGISGNTVRDLFNRLTDDVIQHQPDWISIKIGINDVNSSFHEQGVSPEEYAEVYGKILERLKADTSAKIVLVDPFFLSTDSEPGTVRTRVLEQLAVFLKTVKSLADEYATKHVRTHEAFQEQLRHRTPDFFCPEPVHPYANGHLVIAHTWLTELGW